MFELEVNHDSLAIDDLPVDILNLFQKHDSSIQALAILPWEEHCTECAMPLCYQTCSLYEQRKDGKCRRFTGGITPVLNSHSKQNTIVRVAFKRWGQLMAYANTHMIPLQRAKRIEQGIYALDKMTSLIPDHNLSIRGRHSPSSRLTRRIKQSIARNGYFKNKIADAPDYFLIEIYNPNDFIVDLTFTVSNTDEENYDIGFQELLKLNPGFNHYKISVKTISQRVNLKKKFGISFNPNIINEEDEGLSLYFGMTTFVSDPDYKKSDIKLDNTKITHDKLIYIKVVAWDLDNTIWDGILLEDGTDNLKLMPGIVDIIKQLDARGILNTIVSKNNADDALAQIERFGLTKYMLYPKIGWEQKGLYLKTLVKQFNVGEDTFAFFDDSPFERDEAVSLNPKIRVYDALEYSNLLNLPEFNPPINTESSKRRDLYKLEGHREEALSSHSGDYISFLKLCNIKLDIYSPTSKNLERIIELVQRTNQLNFSGNRYEHKEISNILKDANYDTFCLDCEDKYGKYGTIGFAIVDKSKDQLIDLMFSCRVQSKRVEHAFFSFLLTHFQQRNIKLFYALYNQTDRNKKSGAVFKDMNFIKTEADQSTVTYMFDLENSVPSDNIIDVSWNGEKCLK